MDQVNFESVWTTAISVAGIGAIGSLVLLSLYMKWLQWDKFVKLTKKQTFELMRLFLILTFLFAIIALTFWFLTNDPDLIPSKDTPKSTLEEDLRLQSEEQNLDCSKWKEDDYGKYIERCLK